MIFADPATPLETELHEDVCSLGHIHNGHLPSCPWCLEGHGPGYQIIDPSTESR